MRVEKIRGVASSSRSVSRIQPEPLRRQAFQTTFAAASEGIGEPRRAKIWGASTPKRATRSRHACASARESAEMRATVVSRSWLTPRKEPSRKTLAKQSVAGANASPCASRASLWAAKKPRSGEHRKVHRAEVVTEAGQRQLSRLDRAAGLSVGFDDGDRPALFGQSRRRRPGRCGRRRLDNGVECVHSALVHLPPHGARCIISGGRRTAELRPMPRASQSLGLR